MGYVVPPAVWGGESGNEGDASLSGEKGDLTKADVYVKNTTTGTANVYTMEKVGVLGDDEYWEAVFTPSTPGVYGYKFIAQDAGTKVEYGEDTQEGQWGKPWTAVQSCSS